MLTRTPRPPGGHRRGASTRAAAALVAMAVALTACGGSGQPDGSSTARPADSAASTEAAREAELTRLLREIKAAESGGDQARVAELEDELVKLELEEDAEFEIPRTPFDRVVDDLPLHRPPLYVAQLMIDEGSHRLVVRPPARKFFCGRSLDERLRAVRSYYTAADRRMRAAGVRDLELVVDALRNTGTVRALAVAEKGKVRLTKRGRGAGPC